jgi:FkbM family methyltransferase
VIMHDAGKVVKFVWDHPANEGKRARALLRAVTFQARGRILNKRTLARIGDHSYIWACLHRTSASKAVYANPPDYPEMPVWQRTLMPRDLFVDVGANVGSYSIMAGDLGAEVIALEPAPDTFALLTENVRLNGYPVTTIQAAAGASCGVARFTSGHDSVNRLAVSGPVEVEMVTLDSVIRDRVVAGMKIDVEGFEIDVLRGCEQALSEQRLRLIQLEWNSSSIGAVGSDRAPIAELLARYGYRLYRPDINCTLVPTADLGFGPDVFARPDLHGVHGHVGYDRCPTRSDGRCQPRTGQGNTVRS